MNGHIHLATTLVISSYLIITHCAIIPLQEAPNECSDLIDCDNGYFCGIPGAETAWGLYMGNMADLQTYCILQGTFGALCNPIEECACGPTMACVLVPAPPSTPYSAMCRCMPAPEGVSTCKKGQERWTIGVRASEEGAGASMDRETMGISDAFPETSSEYDGPAMIVNRGSIPQVGASMQGGNSSETNTEDDDDDDDDEVQIEAQLDNFASPNGGASQPSSNGDVSQQSSKGDASQQSSSHGDTSQQSSNGDASQQSSSNGDTSQQSSNGDASQQSSSNGDTTQQSSNADASQQSSSNGDTDQQSSTGDASQSSYGPSYSNEDIWKLLKAMLDYKKSKQDASG